MTRLPGRHQLRPGRCQPGQALRRARPPVLQVRTTRRTGGFHAGLSRAYGQGRGNYGYNNRHDDGLYNTANNPNYQRGFQDGINSGRADAGQGKRPDVDDHPYYRNSNNQAYREGFKQGYREAYNQTRGNNGNYHDHDDSYRDH